MQDKKIGEVLWRDEKGTLWLAEGFVDKDGVTSTQQTEVKEDPPPETTAP